MKPNLKKKMGLNIKKIILFGTKFYVNKIVFLTNFLILKKQMSLWSLAITFTNLNLNTSFISFTLNL